jgi:hypothetical protein
MTLPFRLLLRFEMTLRFAGSGEAEPCRPPDKGGSELLLRAGGLLFRQPTPRSGFP